MLKVKGSIHTERRRKRELWPLRMQLSGFTLKFKVIFQCLYACVQAHGSKDSTAMLAVKRSAGVARGESQESIARR